MFLNELFTCTGTFSTFQKLLFRQKVSEKLYLWVNTCDVLTHVGISVTVTWGTFGTPLWSVVTGSTGLTEISRVRFFTRVTKQIPFL